MSKRNIQAELDERREDLAQWRAARRALSQAKSYVIGNRTLTRANYSEVRQAIIDIEIEISQLENNMGSYMRIVTAVPRG
jgi:hypothetical protein